MATSRKANRTTLVDGCGTILKSNRLKGGYRLVKRKRSIGSTTATASAPKRKAGRPAKAKMVATITEKVVMTAPKRKAGRPAKMRMATAPVMATAKRRGKRKSVKA